MATAERTFLFSVIGIKKLVFNVPQLIGQIHVDGMGVHETFGLLPQRVQLLAAVSLNIHNLGRLVNALAVFENGNHQLPHCVGARGQPVSYTHLDVYKRQQWSLLNIRA